MTITTSPPTSTISQRYLVGLVGKERFAFPESWISDIVTVNHSQILSLPFYRSGMIGIMSYQGKILPLLSARAFCPKLPSLNWNKKNLMAVRLGQSLGDLVGVGVIVERIIQSVIATQLNTENILQPSQLPDSFWLPHTAI